MKQLKPALYKEGGQTILTVSSSLIKKMYFKNMIREDFCNLNFYWCDILKKCPSISSEAMLKGLYFESAILGSTADGSSVTDLPRHKKTGKKLTDHIRIDELIHKWDQYAHLHEIVITKQKEGKNTQLRFSKELQILEIQEHWPGLKVILKMDTDLISPIKDDEGVFHEGAVIDLKLTGSLDNTFGEYAWGEPERIDHLQAFIYSYFLELPFFYVVAGVKEGEYKIFPVNTDRNSEYEAIANEAKMRYKETLRRIIDFINSVMEKETRDQWLLQWPSKSKCKTCPFTHKCKSATQFKSI